MNLYSISELEQFSGIKSHTIRVWEMRYNALKPQRSSGNTRYYDNNQLRRLLNIVTLSEAGYKVAEVSKLLDKDIFSLLEKSVKETITTEPYEYYVSQMIIAAVNYDEPAFEKAFSSCNLRFGFRVTYTKVIYPLLIRIGLMWGKNTIRVAQEHFLSNIIRQKIFASIDTLPPSANSMDSWLLYLPENELHDIGLLFASYLIRLSGRKVFYLGSNVPFNSLKNAVMETSPSNILFFLVHNNPVAETQKYLDNIRKSFKKQNIHVAGNDSLLGQLKLKNINWVNSVEEFKKRLAY